MISRRLRAAPPVLASPPTTAAEWSRLYERCAVAVPSDDAELRALCRDVAMRAGSLSISAVRSPDYFTAARESGAIPWIITLRDPDGAASGTMSIIVRDATLDGRALRYGYACDLRTLPRMRRETWTELARCYAEAVRYLPSIDDVGRPEIFLTTVIDSNERALRLLRARMPGLTYAPLERYEVVQSFFRVRPTIDRLPRGVKVRRATASDATAITALLTRDTQSLGLSAIELERRLRTWDDFAWTSFFVAEADGRIIACVAPREQRSKKAVLSGLTRGQRFASSLIPLFGGRAIKDGEPLDALYLTHLVCDDPAILRAFFLHAHELRRRRGLHAICWIEWPRFGSTRIDMRGFACVRTAGTLYQVVLQGAQPLPPFAAPPALDVSTL